VQGRPTKQTTTKEYLHEKLCKLDAKFENEGLIFKAVLADKISKMTRKDE
jgi:hypothetical protein